MSSLHDEFARLRQILDLMKRRERLKMEFHQASGEYVEAAHRTLLHRLHRQRTGQGGWKDDLDDEQPARSISHKKGAAAAAALAAAGGAMRSHQPAMGGGQARPEQRSHKKRHNGPGRPPKDSPTGTGAGGATAPAPRQRDRDRDRDRHRSHRPTVPPVDRSGFVAGSYLRAADGSDELPTYDDVDSEEEAFSQLVLTVDTTRRDELIRCLPRHLRNLPEPSEDDPLPHLDAEPSQSSSAPQTPATIDAPQTPSFGFGSMLSIGAAAAAAAAPPPLPCATTEPAAETHCTEASAHDE